MRNTTKTLPDTVLRKTTLVERIRQQLSLSFKRKDAVLQRPKEFEIQILPNGGSNSCFSIGQTATGIKGRRNKNQMRTRQDKLVHTASNLG
ncbi:hypothetical protein AAKU67_002817 [Oxalobacteraceae bacterium GrIS 2.11]